MKILMAIESSKRAEEMAHTTFRWAARAGFDIRVFCPRGQVKTYRKYIDDANYHYYLVSRDENEIVVANKKPMEYAKKHGYDLILLLPDNLLDYHAVEDDDKSMIEFATDAGKARTELGMKPDLMELPLEQNPDCVMQRVV